ncbi:hypothetical protein Tcan_05840 [Toxocara canis]|uniref:Uncharacterized protein n=1 Tax=Toxocara canis TaxID=6265 RepID=A0A0B2VPE8_TOXCA|nr:hypothetical protein Tcan_05840 [Toxocara canis]
MITKRREGRGIETRAREPGGRENNITNGRQCVKIQQWQPTERIRPSTPNSEAEMFEPKTPRKQQRDDIQRRRPAQQSASKAKRSIAADLNALSEKTVRRPTNHYAIEIDSLVQYLCALIEKIVVKLH